MASLTPYYEATSQPFLNWVQENINTLQAETLYRYMRNFSPAQISQVLAHFPQDTVQSAKLRAVLGMFPEELRDTVRALLLIRRSRAEIVTAAQWAQQHTPPEADGYVLTDLTHVTDIPSLLPINILMAPCRSLHVEFLEISAPGMSNQDRENAKNRAVLKVNFSSQVGPYLGARISMDVDYDSEYEGSNFKPGRLMVKPIAYDAPSLSSVRTFLLAMNRGGLVFGDIIGTLLGVNLHQFDFTTVGHRFYGCRDFVRVPDFGFTSTSLIPVNSSSQAIFILRHKV
ncbi:uncharacterized protein BDZ99DRAFT_566212 [Mytilinidion resinicola]|uniref:Uncharacterized protein n=1 Tax=Mytilinidion resinicola TaxID=574789 RepID=A0A6A6Z7T0_9PEZI|nr:uncharacterized protein BDZ99DRAFT_566212 [Mytilinidion resinicola]KAF2816374.1 hypothetical protein BDZ99DRAFT_566212 [Mytilinidion resinicola]